MDTDPDEDGGEPSSVATASQAGSHFPLLRPASGATLFGLEVARRANLNDGRGRLRTGCAEVDDETLLGGFERGAVVGVSAEGEGFGMLVSVLLSVLKGGRSWELTDGHDTYIGWTANCGTCDGLRHQAARGCYYYVSGCGRAADAKRCYQSPGSDQVRSGGEPAAGGCG